MPEAVFSVFLNTDEIIRRNICKLQGHCRIFAVGEMRHLFQTFYREESFGEKSEEVLQRPLQNIRTPAARY